MWDIIKAIVPSSSLVISGMKFSPVAKAFYVTQEAPCKKYAKFFDADHRVLVISPDDNLLYFGKDVGNLGDDLPMQQKFEFEGRSYALAAEDYQIVVQSEFGNPANTEGEVRFWDYECTSHPGNLISLGLVAKTQQRADIVAHIIAPSEIIIDKNL